MPQIPTRRSVVGTVEPSRRPLAYLNVNARPQAFGSAIGEALAGLGGDLQKVAAQWQEREGKTKRFDALTQLNNWQTEIASQLTDLKRDTPPTGEGYIEKANSLFEASSQAFLSRLPQDLHDEFGFRISQIRQGVLADALKFQYEAQDAFFRQGVKDALSAAQLAVTQDPSSLDAQLAAFGQAVDDTDLSDIEKAELKRLGSIDIRSRVYKELYKRGAVREGALGLAPVGSTYLDKVEQIESGGNPNAKAATGTAAGYFGFTKSTWLDYVSRYAPEVIERDSTGRITNLDEVLSLRSDKQFSRRMATFLAIESADYLDKRGLPPTEGNLYLAHFLGNAGAAAVLEAAPDTPIERVVGADAIRSNPAVFKNISTAGELVAWAAQKMGKAAFVEDSRFADIPFETRIALQEDAQREAAAELAAQQKAASEAYSASLNQLKFDISDGTSGLESIMKFRADNPNMPFSDYESLLKILEDRNDGIAGTRLIQDIVAGRVLANPEDAEQKKAYNKWFESTGGQDAFNEQNDTYVDDVLLPTIRGTSMIPQDAIGMLRGMIRGTDVERARWAFETLRKMAEAEPWGFEAQVDDKTFKALEKWTTLEGLIPDEQLLARINRQFSPGEQAQRKALEEEALDLLRNINYQSIANAFEGMTFTSTPLPARPAEQQLFRQEFNALFREFYVDYGDAEAAKQSAIKTMKMSWGVTSIGERYLMKYPPEKAGYQVYEKMPGEEPSFDFITDQIRQELGLSSSDRFQLISDQQTEDEVEALKGAAVPLRPGPQDPTPPSYLVTRFDRDLGVWRLVMSPDGKEPYRINFQVTPKMEADKRAALEARQTRSEVLDFMRDYRAARLRFQHTGTPIPKELSEAYKRYSEQYQAAKKVQEKYEALRTQLRDDMRRIEAEMVPGRRGGAATTPVDPETRRQQIEKLREKWLERDEMLRNLRPPSGAVAEILKLAPLFEDYPEVLLPAPLGGQ